VLVALALAAPAQAKYFTLPNAAVHVRIEPDGSLAVREDITFAFFGPFSGAYRDIPLRKGESIDRIRVFEDGHAYTPGASAKLGSSGAPATFGTDVSSKRARIVWHYSAIDETRTFEVRYRFRGLAVAYDDVVDVNLKVWGSEWKQSLAHLTASMALPRRNAAPHTFLVFGAPEYVHGRTHRATGVALLDALDIPAHQFVEERAVFPREFLRSTVGAKVVNGLGGAKVIGEVRADAANLARDRRRIRDAEHHLPRTILILLALATLPAALVAAVAFLLFGREPRVKGYDREYEQDPPSDLEPALVAALLGQSSSVGSLEFTATLFDLIRRGRYKSSPVTTERKKWGGIQTQQVADLEVSMGDEGVKLAKFEQPVAAVIDSVVKDGAKPLSQFRDEISAHRTSNSERFTKFKEKAKEDISARGWFDYRAFVIALVAAIVLGLAGALLLYLGLHGYRQVAPRWADVVQIAIGVCLVTNAAALVLFLFSSRATTRRKPAIAAEAARWEAFRRYLTDFPRLQDAPPATLVLWERLLVYGIALGIAERVLQGAQLHMPKELADTSSVYWVNNYGDLDSGPTSMSIGDLSSGFGSALSPPSTRRSGGWDSSALAGSQTTSDANH